MSILVVAEHDNNAVNPATLKTLAAAKAIGGDIDVLVAGKDCATVADELAKAEGVNKVVLADNAVYEHQLAENVALVADLGKDYSHTRASNDNGQNFMPRVAALLDVAQISDIIAVESGIRLSVRSMQATRLRPCKPKMPLR